MQYYCCHFIWFLPAQVDKTAFQTVDSHTFPWEAPNWMSCTFETHVLLWLALISIDQMNESSLPLHATAGGAGFGEEFRRSSAGGSQTTALQR